VDPFGVKGIAADEMGGKISLSGGMVDRSPFRGRSLTTAPAWDVMQPVGDREAEDEPWRRWVPCTTVKSSLSLEAGATPCTALRQGVQA